MASPVAALGEWLAGFTDSQRSHVLLPYDAKTRDSWSHFPDAKMSWLPRRVGLSIGALNSTQAERSLDLLATFLSERGLNLVHAIMNADSDPLVLRAWLHRRIFNYGADNYYFVMFGEPNHPRWLFRFEGHHVALNVRLESGRVSLGPVFLGAYPARRPSQSQQDFAELVLNFSALFNSTSIEQKRELSAGLRSIPVDLLLTPSVLGRHRHHDRIVPGGLRVASLEGTQKEALLGALRGFWSHFRPGISDSLEVPDLENASLRFKGHRKMDRQYYWQVSSPNFTFEFACRDRDHNHIHALFSPKR